ncbi:MAG: glycosyltransferase family 2 protein [Ferrimicrobium sp.]|uniref:Glycosyltransferase family 2 protein n=1 Tax=Ferrimicrobium acidiphilum TaxID=121039 RepID=A0ABV3Y0C6_9ACTN|nr:MULTISPECIES: glycosyltransferase family 2 protein [Ferrimicrobium]
MRELPHVEEFKLATVLLPVMNETDSLRETIDIVEREAGVDVGEYLILVSPRTTTASRAMIASLQGVYGERIRVHEQSLPFLGGALREGFALAEGSHVVMMASDLETDPHDVAVMIERAKRLPAAIITASRWIRGGSFSGYSPVKLALNKVFQSSFALLYQSPLSDMTYGYRLFPTAVVQAIEWEEVRHPFLLETIVKPLRLGVAVYEIPSRWQARTEGESSNSFFRNFVYFRIGVRTRLRPRASLFAASN